MTTCCPRHHKRGKNRWQKEKGKFLPEIEKRIMIMQLKKRLKRALSLQGTEIKSIRSWKSTTERSIRTNS